MVYLAIWMRNAEIRKAAFYPIGQKGFAQRQRAHRVKSLPHPWPAPERHDGRGGGRQLLPPLV
jgi:hypothetical protein